MVDNVQNSRNPANSGSFAGALQEILGKFLQGVDDMLPGVVVAYDRTTNRATVRAMIQLLKTDETLLDRAEIASVPVLNIGGGNAVLSFNIAPGDLGWIKANDRDISLFLQNLNKTGPNTIRKHSFSDAIFIPDQFRKWTLNAEDDAFAVLQTLDGTQRISIQDSRIKITSDTEILLDAPLVTVTGDLEAVGTIVADSAGNKIGVSTHSHAQPNDTPGDNTEAETDAPTATP